MNNEKKSSYAETLKRLFSWLRRKRKSLFLAFVLTITANTAALFIPYYAGKAIDAAGEAVSAGYEPVILLCLNMFVCVLISSLFSYFTQILLVRISSKITEEMRQEVFEHLLRLPVSFFDRTPAGEIISRISYDIDTINTSLSSDLVQASTSLIIVIGSLIMMIRISPQLCAVFAVLTPLTIYITKHRASVVRPLFHKRSTKLGELNGFSEEMLSGQKTIKAYGREETMTERFDEKNEEAVVSYYEADYQGSIVGPTIMFINNLSLAVLSGLGGMLYLSGSITAGQISSFILYSRRFSGPVSEMAEIMAEMQSALSAAGRVFALLDEPAETADPAGAEVLDNVRGDIAFRNVRFGYEEGREIIHGLDLEAESGQMIAVVGPTGAGKTTIINLLMRFYDPQSGCICVDGKDIMACTRDSLRRQFSMVLQDTWLFGGTICENVAYGRDNASREDVERVCRAADIHDFIMSLKDGYDTVLSDEGVNISKGQKQLLTIARAMLSESRMLILDEATSNVDSQTEKRIRKAMRELCRGRTTIIIAHRLSTIREADQILVLRQGTVTERGTHDELLAEKGFYASLFNAQWEH